MEWKSESNKAGTTNFYVLYDNGKKTKSKIHLTTTGYEGFAYTSKGCKSERGSDIDTVKRWVENTLAN